MKQHSQCTDEYKKIANHQSIKTTGKRRSTHQLTSEYRQTPFTDRFLTKGEIMKLERACIQLKSNGQFFRYKVIN